MIIHIEPDILECEVKWALKSITKNLVEVMECQLSYFKTQKMTVKELLKCCTQYASKFGIFSRGHRPGQAVFIPIPKKGNAKNAQSTVQLYSSDTLVK